MSQATNVSNVSGLLTSRHLKFLNQRLEVSKPSKAIKPLKKLLNFETHNYNLNQRSSQRISNAQGLQFIDTIEHLKTYEAFTRSKNSKRQKKKKSRTFVKKIFCQALEKRASTKKNTNTTRTSISASREIALPFRPALRQA